MVGVIIDRLLDYDVCYIELCNAAYAFGCLHRRDFRRWHGERNEELTGKPRTCCGWDCWD